MAMLRNPIKEFLSFDDPVVEKVEPILTFAEVPALSR
jgi:hypothetical protein